MVRAYSGKLGGRFSLPRAEGRCWMVAPEAQDMLETYACFAHFQDQYPPGRARQLLVRQVVRGEPTDPRIQDPCDDGIRPRRNRRTDGAVGAARDANPPQGGARLGERLKEQLATRQAGKFITIYTTGPQQRDQVVRELDPKMGRIGLPSARSRRRPTRRVGCRRRNGWAAAHISSAGLTTSAQRTTEGLLPPPR